MCSTATVPLNTFSLLSSARPFSSSDCALDKHCNDTFGGHARQEACMIAQDGVSLVSAAAVGTVGGMQRHRSTHMDAAQLAGDSGVLKVDVAGAAVADGQRAATQCHMRVLHA